MAYIRRKSDEITNMDNVQNVFVQVLRKPKRKVIIKRGIKAQDYFPYCEEVGCDVWGILVSMDSLCKEPVCPLHFASLCTSRKLLLIRIFIIEVVWGLIWGL